MGQILGKTPTSSVQPQRFQARIGKQGPNPYVDVPEGVSLAFTHHSRGGRVSVEGRLNEASIRASLVPIGKGRHRLYVNGGMRAAAGVAVGDTVSFELLSTAHANVSVPEDLADALDEVDGAREAFEAMSPSHRRELIRHVDDARTPSTRERRIGRSVDHALGKPPADRRPSGRPMWNCPRCGNRFVNKNQYHSCKRYSLSDPFEGKPDKIRGLFDRFREIVEAQGPVKMIPYSDAVGFMVRVRFGNATPRTRWVDIGLWLPRRVESPRFRRVETIYPNAHVHVLRITEADQLDEEVESWVKEAYQVGQGT